MAVHANLNNFIIFIKLKEKNPFGMAKLVDI